MKLWDNLGSYRFFRHYVDACTKRSFSKLTIEGKENIPSDGMVIFAPNHCCTMTDAMLTLCGSDCEPVLYGARADIFRNPKVASILRYLRIVPMGRQRDGVEAVARNEYTFSEVIETMCHGIPFCIFCEGTHFTGREVHSLRKGIVRIAGMALQSSEKPVYIVPVGISYDYFYRFKNRATLRYGSPIKCSAELLANSSDLLSDLRNRIQSLVDTDDPVRRTDRLTLRILLGILLLPVFAAAAVLASPILLPTLWFTRKLKDKAWLNTIRYGCSLLLFVFWPFQGLFYIILNYYNNLFEDLK